MAGVTHETLRENLATLTVRFEEHHRLEGEARADRIRRDALINDELAAMKGQLGDGKTSFALIHQDLHGIHETLKEVKNSMMSLTAANDQRKGERGVWATLLRSPVFAWLAAIVAGLAAWLHGFGAPSQ